MGRAHFCPQGHLATPSPHCGGEQASEFSQSGEESVGQYSTPSAWKRVASAGSGVIPGSLVSLMRIGAQPEPLLGVSQPTEYIWGDTALKESVCAASPFRVASSLGEPFVDGKMSLPYTQTIDRFCLAAVAAARAERSSRRSRIVASVGWDGMGCGGEELLDLERATQ